jgi:hypothetical protein
MLGPISTNRLLIGEGRPVSLGCHLDRSVRLCLQRQARAASPTWRRCGAHSKHPGHQALVQGSQTRAKMFLVQLPVRPMYGSNVSQGSDLAMSTEPFRGSDAISVREFADMRCAGKAHTVLDVPEARELDVCRLEGALHIPMTQIPTPTDDLPTDQLLVVICHHGRSQSNDRRLSAKRRF